MDGREPAAVPSRRRRLPGRPVGPSTTRIAAITVTCGLIACGLAALAPWRSSTAWVLPLVWLGVAVAERLLLHIDVGDQRRSFSTTHAFVALMLLIAPDGWLVPAVAGGMAAAQTARRMPALNLAFNTAVYGLAAAAAVALAGGLPLNRVVAAAIGMSAFWLVNSGLVSLVIAVSSGRRLRHVLRETGRWSLTIGVALIGSGLLAGWLLRNAPWGLLGLMMPLALVGISYDQQARRNAEAALFSEVFRAQRDRLGASPDLAAEVLVGVAAKRLSAYRSELVVFTASEGPVHYRTRPGGGVLRHRVHLPDLDAPWLVSALAAIGTVGGVRQGRPWSTSTVGDPDSPTAVLALWRAAGGRRFTARELALTDLLVRQAATWLSPPPQTVQSGSGASAMRDLREAAGRLVLLSAGGLEPAVLHDVVDEVHVLESAVARLAAAAAGGSEPASSGATAGDARSVEVEGSQALAPTTPWTGDWDGVDRRRQTAPTAVPETGRRLTDWTTTGLLTHDFDEASTVAAAHLPRSGSLLSGRPR